MKIVTAEDEAISRTILDAALRDLGHDVVPCANGTEALAAWATARPPVVIADWQMPEMDGLEFCRRIRAQQDNRYTYFILLTARTGKDSFLAAMDAEVDDFLTKPMDRDELAARLRVAQRILGLRQDILALSGLLPICSYCRRIRDNAGKYGPLEEYVAQHAGAAISHGICPECYAKHVEPELEQL